MVGPPRAIKNAEPLRFGILGAANIAPIALIVPCLSHPDAVVTAVAARSLDKAQMFAKKHDIPTVYGGSDAYQSEPASGDDSRLIIMLTVYQPQNYWRTPALTLSIIQWVL